MRTVILAGALLIGATQLAAQDFDPMQMADTNGDNKVTLAEATTFSEAGWQFATQGAPDKVKKAEVNEMAAPMFATTPVDAGGNYTRKAFLDGVPARFKAADKNGDGTLDEAELFAFLGMPR